MTPSERALLWRRSSEQFQFHQDQARAAGKCLMYRLEELRDFLERSFANPSCPYCRRKLSVGTFTVDHKLPIARGGRFTFRNLEVACLDCRQTKGVLDSQEFRELLLVVHSWPRPVQKVFLSRLRAGGAHCTRKLPPLGALEWFTGSDAAHAPADVD